MTTYTKQRVTLQYTEFVFYKDGQEIGRQEQYDCHEYDAQGFEQMTEEEIADWA